MTHPAPHTHDPSHDAHAPGAHSFADRMGIGVSLGCAVHCAATGALSIAPSFASLGGASASSSIADLLEWLETPFLAFALLVGLYALVPAYRNEHGNPQPLALFLVGLAQLVASRFVEGPMEIAITVIGVVFIASAHLVNLRACARVHRESAHGCTVATSDGRA